MSGGIEGAWIGSGTLVFGALLRISYQAGKVRQGVAGLYEKFIDVTERLSRLERQVFRIRGGDDDGR